MDSSKNKIIGAFLIGFAIVAGAYTTKNFGKPTTPPPQQLSASVVAEAPARVFIDVSDSNNDGLEDWRDQFINTAAVTLSTDEEYELPTTLTDQVGISFLQNVISAEAYGAFGQSREEIIVDTADKISAYAKDKIFDVKDVAIGNDASPAAIRLYANAVAQIIKDNSIPDLRNEALILRDVLDGTSESGIDELKSIAGVYGSIRDDLLKLSVPPTLVKEHLDHINVTNALYNDINSMAIVGEDPMLTLVRLKRYEEDASGLALAMRNIYSALEPHAALFKVEDPALLFVSFSPSLNKN